MTTHRTERVAQMIQRSLASILVRDVSDPLLRRIAINGVKVSKDLKQAKVYFDWGTENPKDIQKELKRATPFLRKSLARDLDLRYVPELQFWGDDEARRIKHLFETMDREIHGASSEE